ncbi:MAG: hypothetical protein PUJ84_01040 [Mollicutes bacterium]|nr:hypothetical protein [Mollicutes bacterium]
MGAITCVSFNDLASLEGKDIEPVFIYFEKNVYQVSSWYELIKIFFYELNQKDKGKSIIEDNKNVEIFGEMRIFDRDNLYFAKSQYVKFGTDLYASIGRTGLINLRIIKLFRQAFMLDHGNFRIYVKRCGEEISAKELTRFQFEQKLNNRIVKKGRGYVAHINGLILSPWEKLRNRINKEFKVKKLIGDITLDENEIDLIKCYMYGELLSLANKGKSFKPKEPMVFTTAMVLYAQNYYSEGRFWNNIEKAFGVPVDTNKQKYITEACTETFKNYGKTFTNETKRPIDIITLHSFVSTPCANQFFNYLFDYWRLDLGRNVNNLYDEDGKDKFDILINEIKRNKETGLNGLMVHTSLALIHNPVGCKVRLKKYLNLIDSCFWNNEPIPNSNTRLIRLLKEWSENPNGNFQKEFSKEQRKKTGRGETLLLRPTLFADFEKDSFSLHLNRQIILDCTEDEASHLYWAVDINGETLQVNTTPLSGKAGIYVEQCAINDLEPTMIFSSIKANLVGKDGKIYLNREIKESNIRFFDEKGKWIDHSRGNLPSGRLYICYKDKDNVPQLIGKDLIGYYHLDYYLLPYEFKKGDVLILNDGTALWVGERMEEGLLETSLVEGVEVDTLPVYKKLPFLFFRCKESDIDGSFILVNDSKTPINLSSLDVKPFKINDSSKDNYGYFLDLSNRVLSIKEGRVSILIKFKTRKQITKDFYYLDNFKYEFIDAPYVFKQTGTIKFISSIPIIRRSELWEFKNDYYELSFDLDPSREEQGFRVSNQRLFLPYSLGEKEIEVAIKIPALYWRFSNSDEWNYERPIDQALRKMSEYIYIDTPYDNDSISIFADLSNQEIESDGKINKEISKAGLRFKIGEIKSYETNSSEDSLPVKIIFNNEESLLFEVRFHAILKKDNSSVFADFDKNEIFGHLEIIGDGDYSVSINGNDVDVKDIPVEDGEFKYIHEGKLIGGKYAIRVYENQELDDGFDDSISIPLTKEPLYFKLLDVCHLENTKFRITGIRFISNEQYLPLRITNDSFIRILERLDIPDLFEKEKEEKFEILIEQDKSVLEGKDAICYKGVLVEEGYLGKEFFVCNVMVIYPSKLNPNEKIVLKMEEEQAIDLYYNHNIGKIVNTDNDIRYKNYPMLKYKEIIELIDTKYSLNLVAVEE